MGRPLDREGKIFSEDLIAKALRDSGYKNTAYALAELIDNSIQAGAENIEVICLEERTKVEERKSSRLCKIAVIDDGSGMDSEILRAALMFGNGTHLNDRTGIGRFGMGLPNASFSVSERVEVWSWQDGHPNALWTFLDLENITDGIQKVVPIPEAKPLPDEWLERVKHRPRENGTLVLWSALDESRLTWKTGTATLKHTETIVGRIYRYFIYNEKVKIRLVSFGDNGTTTDEYAQANDPMYLLHPTSTPKPFDNQPMFQQWGDEDEVFPISFNEHNYEVRVRFSYARPETADSEGQERGGTTYGKHAGKNIGVSLVREGRELDLDSNWAIGYDPRERWWGCEVTFPAALDELFGVTINKQTATLWSQFAQLDYSALAEDNENRSIAVIERLKDEGDYRGFLLQIAEYIRSQLKNIRDEIKDQTKGGRSIKKRHNGPTIEETASNKYKNRAKEQPTPEDQQEFGENEAEGLKNDLVDDKNYSEKTAEDIVKAVWDRDLTLIFLEANLDGYAFFKVEEKPGNINQVIFNRNHPFYEKLYEVMDCNQDFNESISIEERLANSLDALRLMFAAWARLERESNAKERGELNDIRQDWGKMVRYFLANENGD